MPYKTRKVRGKNCYKVYKPSNGKIFAKCTTKDKALKQMRLLKAVRFNKNFKPIRSNRTIKKTKNSNKKS
tara:strand:+ start:6421 stop:6630 length:210 start_codon:yes stop_codon:yes gene_type:complete